MKFFIVAGVAGDLEQLGGIDDEDGLPAVFKAIENPNAKTITIAARTFVVERGLQWTGTSRFYGGRRRGTRSGRRRRRARHIRL